MSDQHLANAERIYLVTQQFGDGEIMTGFRPIIASPIATYLKEDFPEIEAIARVGSKREWTVSAGDRRALLTGARADRDLLRIFNFDVIAGDLTTALNTYDQVIITRHAADALFGDTNPIGQTISFAEDFYPIVVAVIETPSAPSHMSQDSNAFGHFDFIYSWPDDSEQREWWLGISAVTYLLLPEDPARLVLADFRERLRDFVARRLPADQAALSSTEIDILPLSGLQSRLVNLQLFEGGSKTLSIEQILYALGLLVLLVACVNYANLSTAQAISRAKEIGMRKVIGAGAPQILQQYWLEAILLTTVAAVIAIAGLWLLAPVIQAQSGIDLRLGLFDEIDPILLIFGLIFFVAFISSIYPVVVLSRVIPIDALRQGSMTAGPRNVGRALVSLQFCVASALLIILIVILQQNQYLESRALAGTDDDIVLLTDGGSREVGVEAIAADLATASSVLVASDIDYLPWSDHENFLEVALSRGHGTVGHTVFYNQVGYNFIDVFDRELLAGRFFSETHNDTPSYTVFSSDIEVESIPVVVDQVLLNELGIASPAAAIGTELFLSRQFVATFGQDPRLKIIGVIENMPLVLAASGNNANIYGRSDQSYGYPVFRIRKESAQGALQAIRESVENRNPNALVNFRFIEDAFAEGFRTFKGISAALFSLSIIAMIISFMGLIGMVTFTVAKRRHEVGVRKTLGASSVEIVTMLLVDFSKPVILGSLLAWPLAYLGAQVYLGNFIERVPLTITPWLSALLAASLVAWFAVVAQSYRAARVKPADVLRYE